IEQEPVDTELCLLEWWTGHAGVAGHASAGRWPRLAGTGPALRCQRDRCLPRFVGDGPGADRHWPVGEGVRRDAGHARRSDAGLAGLRVRVRAVLVGADVAARRTWHPFQDLSPSRTANISFSFRLQRSVSVTTR